MTRRDALRQSVLVIGGTAVSTSLLSGLLVSCTSDPSIDWTPEFLTIDEAGMLNQFIDILLPTTDTPGAVEAGVPEFLDKFAQNYLPSEVQQKFRDGLMAINKDSEAKYGKPFNKLSNEQQTELINIYDEAAFGEGKEGSDLVALDFYKEMKSNICWAYCTSELGATKHLQFDFDPGEYVDCVPIDEVGGKVWVYP